MLGLLCCARMPAGHAQVLSLAAAAGPVFLPGSGAGTDWHALLALNLRTQPLGGRLETMYMGVPGADLVALTGNVVWRFPRERATAVEPYLIVGAGAYLKFSEQRFGLNGGAGVQRPMGPLRLFAEVRYHRVTRRFEEARDADTFIPVSVGVALGH
ncbi:MAG TPA: hypothetical protein VMY76_05600 [Gemmatimonadales bacterium]|nr:hypothetical protein [Gemmatimonadales bacterium]